MEKKPQDLLEFLRRTTGADGRSLPEQNAMQPLRAAPTEMVVRRSQVMVAGIAAGLLVLLAFILGLTFGGSAPESEGPAAGASPVWGIRAITYKATEQGEIDAKITMGELEAVVPAQVSIHRLRSSDQVVVVVGAWLRNPETDSRFRALLEQVKTQRNVVGDQPFHDAGMWQIPR